MAWRRVNALSAIRPRVRSQLLGVGDVPTALNWVRPHSVQWERR